VHVGWIVHYGDEGAGFGKGDGRVFALPADSSLAPFGQDCESWFLLVLFTMSSLFYLHALPYALSFVAVNPDARPFIFKSYQYNPSCGVI